ncbi:RNA polymerase sigma-70 factor (sigma-E family) [Kibdelosporangium banguiense]|uniref:RNA polymerase sigma-70 factor (Sigma-E family) n=1 Tax=Kibdelosporangium banguiense TaxID=1365924 RepID=A0ABS4TME1_9PSEU|nr:SigE family RNA polymerase sigma factor [Kibdelosporangium banguiense]MBP2325514.1 RNA polymerase sigma-70 factor (sigma-E family) [Kibdelosporangium banguiense]
MRDSPGDLAFEEYFESRSRRLRRLAYAMCGDWHLAEDITQNTFIRLYQRWKRVRPETADAYARRILTNVFLSGVPKRKREQAFAAIPDEVAPQGRNSEERLDIAAALRDLSPSQRAMVVLRFMEDLSIAEVAELMGVAQGTVKSQTSRGVEALRTALEIPEGVMNDGRLAY